MEASKRYLDYLESIFEVEPLLFMNNSKVPDLPGVASLVFKDIPEPGYVTGFSYGLSLYNNHNWIKGRPELCITVKSEDIMWGRVAGIIANEYRGILDFSYGDRFDSDFKILSSKMTAYFI